MIPKPDQLEVISHMKSGDLAKTPYPVLLHALAVQRLSVVLEIERKQLRKRISIEDGVPVDVRRVPQPEHRAADPIRRARCLNIISVMSRIATSGCVARPTGDAILAVIREYDTPGQGYGLPDWENGSNWIEGAPSKTNRANHHAMDGTLDFLRGP